MFGWYWLVPWQDKVLLFVLFLESFSWGALCSCVLEYALACSVIVQNKHTGFLFKDCLIVFSASKATEVIWRTAVTSADRCPWPTTLHLCLLAVPSRSSLFAPCLPLTELAATVNPPPLPRQPPRPGILLSIYESIPIPFFKCRER